MEVFSPTLRKLWKERELQALVLLSLTLQLVLIILGHRRKYNRKIWIGMTVWSAYLMADSVAVIAIGIISNRLGDIYTNAGSLDASLELNAFWGPFLLLHLGGPGTITAYSLEDNELWRRHLLGLAVQTGVTLYVFLMAWTGSRLSILTILMILAGLIKYGERTWVLWSASNKQFRKSMLKIPSNGPKNLFSNDEYELKKSEGYNGIPETVIEVQLLRDLSVLEDNSIPEEDILLTAHSLFEIVKRFFVDAELSNGDGGASQTIFTNLFYKNAFRVIEVQLGFIYDLFYTKSSVTYTRWGIGLRFISFSVTCIVLVFFSLSDQKHEYSKVDLSITFVLLAVAILIEIYSALIILSSDQTVLWLILHNKTSISRAICSHPSFKSPRWSNTMAQDSLLSYFLKEKYMICQRISNLKKVTALDNIKKLIFTHFKKIFEEIATGKRSVTDVCSSRGSYALGYLFHRNKGDIFNKSIDAELEQIILVWNIATEILYYKDRDYFLTHKKEDGDHTLESIVLKRKMSKHISRYMLYLVTECRDMLPPAGVLGQISFWDTCAQALKVFRDFDPKKVQAEANKIHSRRNVRTHAWKWLSQLSVADSETSLLGRACNIAKALEDREKNPLKQWDIISGLWVEMLVYTANQCRGNQHLQQLKRGGEFLTHVWLLMAHFGFTHHFKLSKPRGEIVNIITR